MKVKYSDISYKPGDAKFSSDDKLMSATELKESIVGLQEVANLTALGACVWNIIHQGDDPDANTYLRVQGDEQTGWVNLYQGATADFRSAKSIAHASTFQLMSDAYDMLDGEAGEDLSEHLSKEGVSLSKCLLAGILAKLSVEDMTLLVLIPGASKMASLVSQLRQ